ncbi:hypothetical protein BER2_3039 [plant metagenome]|uniref:Uncharacterized protein n=1 Tax=plant metagenome TaxID=1297885 RepID=A0A484U0E6_9ZZZZ
MDTRTDTATPLTLRWEGLAFPSLEHLHVQTLAGGTIFDAVVVMQADSGQRGALRYRLHVDAAWRTRRLFIQEVGSACSIQLQSDGHGRWTAEGGALLPELAGAIDVDLSVSPATHTLPIRRLDLAEGASAEIHVVHVGWPGLALSKAPQRYTRLAGGRYRFESLDADFRRDISVDADGFVRDYPDLFRRA